MFSDRDNVRAGDFSNGDTAIGLVGSVEINMIRSNTSSDGNLKLFCFRKTLSSQITRMEAMAKTRC